MPKALNGFSVYLLPQRIIFKEGAFCQLGKIVKEFISNVELLVCQRCSE